jgi:hypothetical protein
MQPLDQAGSDPGTSSSQLFDWIRVWVRSPRGLIIIGIAVIVGGLALNWNWLTALGFAPLILSVAPCAVMCALGMCMMGGGKKFPSVKQPDDAAPQASSAPVSSSEPAP